jgi:hypothetical protein
MAFVAQAQCAGGRSRVRWARAWPPMKPAPNVLASQPAHAVRARDLQLGPTPVQEGIDTARRVAEPHVTRTSTQFCGGQPRSCRAPGILRNADFARNRLAAAHDTGWDLHSPEPIVAAHSAHLVVPWSADPPAYTRCTNGHAASFPPEPPAATGKEPTDRRRTWCPVDVLRKEVPTCRQPPLESRV